MFDLYSLIPGITDIEIGDISRVILTQLVTKTEIKVGNRSITFMEPG